MALESVLATLFPPTGEFLGGISYGPEWKGERRESRRVAREEVLRVYLRAGLNVGTPTSKGPGNVSLVKWESALTFGSAP